MTTQPAVEAVEKPLSVNPAVLAAIESEVLLEYSIFDARRALVRKQEEVRRLQEECAALELRPHASLQPVDPNQLPVADQEAATRIQAIHRGHLSRSSLNTAAGEVSTRTDGIECASGATFSSLTPG